jgi:hypothetical protein
MYLDCSKNVNKKCIKDWLIGVKRQQEESKKSNVLEEEQPST